MEEGNLAGKFSALAVGERNNSDINNNNPRNSLSQDDRALVRIREREQEIMQLRKHLAEYSVKESQIQSEKQVLEKRISLMRKALDQQQQDLVDATSKAIAYRQDILEENIRLSYALQSAQEETMTFVSSLVPLLSEFSPQPQVSNAQSIVSNVRLLFRHYKESLAISELRLRESQYQFAPWWHSDMKPSTSAQSHNLDERENERENERGSICNSPISNMTQSNYDPSPETDGLVVEREQNEENLINSHYLPSILEESSSSIPEHDDDDDDYYDDDDKPLPAVEGLQILGEAYPGHELQASGYSTNGTTHCSFEWVRHLADGSLNYIEGAKQPKYFVTADDVDTYLAVEVQPLDDRQRKGELVKCFANENQKISCHPEMRHYIEKTVSDGHAVYKLSLWKGSHDIWEPALLEIKKDAYSIKLDGPNAVVVAEKFSTVSAVCLLYEIPVEFSIISSGGVERYLRADYSSTDVSRSRDAIVLIMRFFIKRASERKKGKKKKKKMDWFFTK